MAFTFFFRDSHTLEQGIKNLLPLIEGSSRISIWNPGCAMGPETYTFAILLAEKMGHFAFKKVFIDASDIDENGNFEGIINSGLYKYDELKRIPEDVFKKYFEKTEKEDLFKITDNIKSRVNFTKHDLLTLKPIGDSYSLVICKNVLLHLQPDERVKVINMFHSVLVPGGLLITEQTQQLPEDNSKMFTKIATDANIFKKI